ncbi:hypothetical protein BU24DRAFT_416966, partial [Aaosphaeria arxii CBS 175.79]
NNPRSYGWGTLIVAGGGAYYFAKRSINAERAAKSEADFRKRQRQYEMEQAHINGGGSTSSSTSSPYAPLPSGIRPVPPSVVDELKRKREEAKADKDWHVQDDNAGHPSQEANSDPAPTRHAPEDESQKVTEKSN